MVQTPPDIGKDAENDYEYARGKIKKLIETSEEAIEHMMALARDAEHPRAFEVLSQMIQGTANMNSELLKLLGDRKKLHDPGKGSATTTNNTTTNNTAVYVGSTSELQKLLRAEKEKLVIDG